MYLLTTSIIASMFVGLFVVRFNHIFFQHSNSGLSRLQSPNALPDNDFLTYFYYPLAKLIETSTNELFMESNDDPGKITSWYKQQIIDRDIPIKNFITTSQNGQISNYLTGSTQGKSIRIEIYKSASQDKSKISVFISN